MNQDQEHDVSAALLAYWTSRDEAAAAQAARGVEDVGGRAGVTSGGHLDRIAQLLGRVCAEAGVPKEFVYYKFPAGDPLGGVDRRLATQTGYTLPGVYRPTKEWDLVVYAPDGFTPIVAVELKSQNGPSYGNNANNRAEEAIGNAIDLAAARSQRLVPTQELWAGYVFVIEDDAASRLQRRGNAAALRTERVFRPTWSYQDRVRILSQRLVEDGLYQSAWAVATSRPNCPGPKCPQIKGLLTRVHPSEHWHGYDWFELDPTVSGYVQFVQALTEHLAQFYPQVPPGVVPGVGDDITLFD